MNVILGVFTGLAFIVIHYPEQEINLRERKQLLGGNYKPFSQRWSLVGVGPASALTYCLRVLVVSVQRAGYSSVEPGHKGMSRDRSFGSL